MNNKLVPGLTAEVSFVVEQKHLANEVGSGLVSVFSTAMLVAGLETAAVKCVQDYLEEGKTSVGVHVDITHKAATPLGMRVTFTARLDEISPKGNSLVFHLEARDEVELIGEGNHRRVVVDKALFERQALSKLKKRDL